MPDNPANPSPFPAVDSPDGIASVEKRFRHGAVPWQEHCLDLRPHDKGMPVSYFKRQFWCWLDRNPNYAKLEGITPKDLPFLLTIHLPRGVSPRLKPTREDLVRFLMDAEWQPEGSVMTSRWHSPRPGPTSINGHGDTMLDEAILGPMFDGELLLLCDCRDKVRTQTVTLNPQLLDRWTTLFQLSWWICLSCESWWWSIMRGFRLAGLRCCRCRRCFGLLGELIS